MSRLMPNLSAMMLPLILVVSFIAVVDSHGYIESPRSRQYIAWKEGVWSGGTSATYPKEDCPQCANIGGTAGQCGVIGGRNYDKNLNVFGKPMPADPQARYARGQVITVDIVLTAHHKGHFEFSACPIKQGGVATGACFKKYRLKFVSDPWYGAPKDPDYPYRAYIAPPGVSKKNDAGLLYRFKLKLPDNLTGDLVLLQWHYLTANSCIYSGYKNYPFPAKWGNTQTGLGICNNIPSGGGGLPEQFWNCAEISVSGGPVTPTSQASPPAPAPSKQSSPSGNNSQGSCGDGKVGNGVCPIKSLCCSKWGYCGNSAAYCGSASKPTRRPTRKPVSVRTSGTNIKLCGGGVIGSGVCPNPDHCCSKFGYCGTGTAYCGTRRNEIRSLARTPQSSQRSLSTGTCGGGRVGNGKCPDSSLCCSEWGYCGSGSGYCSSSSKPCGGGIIGSGKCSDPSLCCSKFGFCGSGSAYCGATKRRPTRKPTKRPTRQATASPVKVNIQDGSRGTCGGGNVGNGKCSNSALCCSKWGYCGSGSSYCSDSDAPKPSPPTTTESISFPNYADGDCSGVSNVMKVNVGYYQSWAIYRQNGCHRVSPDDIDVDGNGYTHLIYTFASINSNSQLEPWGGDYSTEVSQFRAFTNLKKTNANLKTLIAVGGWTFNDPGATLTRFSDTASTAARRATFAKSCVDFCRTYNFDGVDLDWEYPGDTTRGGDPADMKNFVLLVKAIRSAFDDADEGLQLTMAIPIASFRLEAGYNLPALAGGVNFFNLMTYDIYGTWDSPKVVGANTDMPYIFNAIKYILNTGVSSSKLVLGLAAYGRSYNMEDNSCTAAGCPFSSGGVGGCAGETGFMPYFTIEQYVKSGNYKSLRFNGSTGTMELVIDGNVMISYDSPATMRIKYDFASKACLRGVMWWAVDMKKNPIVLDGNR